MSKAFTKSIEFIPGLYAFAQSVMPVKTLPETLMLRHGLQDFGSYVAAVATFAFMIAGAAMAKRLSPNTSIAIGVAVLTAWLGTIFGFYEYALDGGKAVTPFANVMNVTLWSGMFVLLAFALTFFLTHLEGASSERDKNASA